MLYYSLVTLDISDHIETPDRLHIYELNDDGAKVQRTPSDGVYGVYERPYYAGNTEDLSIRDYKSSGKQFSLDYLGKPTYMYQGFKILLTSVKDSHNGGCKTGYFWCSKQLICIPGELRCDGNPNCGLYDNTDEDGCAELDETVTSLLNDYSIAHAVIAAVVAVLVFLICVALIGLFVTKYNRKRYPLTKVRALLSRGVCSVTTNLDMERLYAPPSYEHVMAGTSSGGMEPPPEYSEFVRTSHHRNEYLTDSEDDDFPDNSHNEFIDIHRKPAPQRTISHTSVHKAMCHSHPGSIEDPLPSTSSTSADTRPNSASSNGSHSSSSGLRHNGEDIDSEGDVKSGDSGIENSRERISKRPQKIREESESENIISSG
ncbi:uncharacterized protein LOC126827867 [Patella vulgata]|uniref:uncharacterized protein LOC126827867 n=1 Tax=Patella vulgata TaxID=6465 RepID=UPI0021802414|nr:uncharacterized protein LOC126827867 [Patella vulgata]